MYMERGCFLRVVRWLGFILYSSRTERLHRLTADSDSDNRFLFVCFFSQKHKKFSVIFISYERVCLLFAVILSTPEIN